MSVLFLSNSKRRRKQKVNEMECRTKAGSRTTRTESGTAQQLYNSALFIYFILTGAFLDTRLTVQLFCVSVRDVCLRKPILRGTFSFFTFYPCKYSVQLVTYHSSSKILDVCYICCIPFLQQKCMETKNGILAVRRRCRPLWTR